MKALEEDKRNWIVENKKTGLPIYENPPLCPKKSSKPIREKYFMVSFIATVEDEYNILDTIALVFPCSYYPTKTSIIEQIRWRNEGLGSIAILAVKELKQMEYEDFIR